MKVVYFIGALLLLTGCQFQNIEITGTAPGMDGSTLSIMGPDGKIIFGTNIQSGKFEIAQQPLNDPGYYLVTVVTNDKNAPIGNGPYEVYLEPGKYNIEMYLGENRYYPHIKSTSAIQNDLTAYHLFTDSALLTVAKESNDWLDKLNDPKSFTLPDKDYQAILANVKLWRTKLDNSATSVLAAFVAKHPNNTVVPHAMANMDMEKDPVKFLAIYQKLGPDVKNSDEGKKIGDKLNNLTKLMPGGTAPPVAGLTPDGKNINIKDLHKKVIVVAFWRSGSSAMADEQYGLAHNLLPLFDGNKLGVVSVSFDTDRSTWLNSIKKSGLDQVQVSDLKGDDSPNVNNWNVTTLPNYYILDENGKVLYDNLSYQAVEFSVKEYMAKH